MAGEQNLRISDSTKCPRCGLEGRFVRSMSVERARFRYQVAAFHCDTDGPYVYIQQNVRRDGDDYNPSEPAFRPVRRTPPSPLKVSSISLPEPEPWSAPLEAVGITHR